MNIWILTSELPTQIRDGIARYVDNFARVLGAAGHEVTIIARSEHPGTEQPAPGVTIVRVVPRYTLLNGATPPDRSDTHPAYPYNILSPAAGLSHQMAETVLELLTELPPPDVIESQELGALPYYLIQRKLTERTPLEHIPILVHLHSPHFDIARINQTSLYRFPDYWTGQMEKFCITAADAVLSPSRFLARDVEQIMQRSLNITTIPYPIRFDTSFEPLDTEPGEIVYAGRLEVRKGVLPLVAACHRLWAEGETFRLTLVGGDTPFQPLDTTVRTLIEQRYAHWLERGQLKLVGAVDQPEVLQYMQQAWAVVIPSLWENFPNTCIETMGVGQVGLVSAAGGQAEMVETNGVNGFIFDWNVLGDFEQKLKQVLHLSPAERLRMAQRAQVRIRALCDPEVVVPQRLEHIQQIRGQQPRYYFPTANVYPTAAKNELLPVSPASPTASDELPSILSVLIMPNRPIDPAPLFENLRQTTYAPLELVWEAQDNSALETANVSPSLNIHPLKVSTPTLQAKLGAVKGEFVALVETDTTLDPKFFERAVALLQRYPNVAFVYTWLRYMGDGSEIWPTWNAELPYMLGQTLVRLPIVARRSLLLAATADLPNFALRFECYDAWLHLLKAGYTGVCLAEPLACSSLSYEAAEQQPLPNQQLYFYDALSRRYADLYREWGEVLFNLQNANGPGRRWPHPVNWVGPDQLEVHINNMQTQIDRMQAYIDQQNDYLQEIEAFHKAPINYISTRDLSQQTPIKKMLKAMGLKVAYKILPARYRLWLKSQRERAEIWRHIALAHTTRVSHSQPKRLEDLQILWVYAKMGAPTRYRVTNQVTQLELHALSSVLHPIGDLRAIEALAQADLLYLYRLEATPLTTQLIKLARRQRIPIVFDTDDLIWDQQIETYCFLRDHWPAQEVDDFLASVARHEQIMIQADYFIVSTPYLAQQAKDHFGKKVFVNKNALAEEAVRLSRPFFETKQAKRIATQTDPVTIVYASGWARAHQEDFGVAVEALRQILRDRPQARLKIVGHLELEDLFIGYENRVDFQEFVTWEKLFEVLSQIDINLAPIVTNPQRRSKSAVKFLEAALVGVPTVASNLEPYQDIVHGETGFLAASTEEWYRCLLTLIDSPDLRRKMGQAAREQILAQDTVALRAPHLKQIITEIIEDFYGNS